LAGSVPHSAVIPFTAGAKFVANPASVTVAGPPGRSVRTSEPAPVAGSRMLSGSTATQQRFPAGESKTIRIVCTDLGRVGPKAPLPLTPAVATSPFAARCCHRARKPSPPPEPSDDPPPHALNASAAATAAAVSKSLLTPYYPPLGTT
jgi:hypothetical protein